MGYTTDFDGLFRFNKPLAPELFNELVQFNKTRHCKGNKGSDSWSAAEGMPGLYCQWVPNPGNTGLIWDGGKKFYDYIPWLKWLIDNKFKPHDIVLNGKMFWHGEDRDDIGTIEVQDNEIFVTKGTVIYEDSKTIKI